MEPIPDFAKTMYAKKARLQVTDIDKLLEHGWRVVLELSAQILNKLDGINTHRLVVFELEWGKTLTINTALQQQSNANRLRAIYYNTLAEKESFSNLDN